MFGFGTLASYKYFGHLERAIVEGFRKRGLPAITFVADVPPTASIRKRALRLLNLIDRTHSDAAGDDGPIHLLGHSTGGLDARLVASPSSTMGGPHEWSYRLKSVTMMNTPHYGTPLATFFATAKGQRMLHAVTALTVLGLSLGTPPLALASALVVGLGRIDKMVGLELSAVDRMTESMLRVLDDTKSREVRTFLEAIRGDQGAVIQLTPEAMDLFHAGVQDRPGVAYNTTISMIPKEPQAMLRLLQAPWSFISAPLFSSIAQITAGVDDRYPCSADVLTEDQIEALSRAYGEVPERGSDGVVPVRSQIWGKVIWAGLADHLDVLGHFREDGKAEHRDWFSSGAGFQSRRFQELTGTIVDAMIASSLGPKESQTSRL